MTFGTLSELRGTGGLLGFYGVLAANNGKLSFVPRGKPAETLPPVSVANVRKPDWFVASYARYGSVRDWRNINVSSDFPAVSGVATAALASPGSLGHVDGIIQVDPIVLEDLLRVGGPITVPTWPEPITADNVSRVTQYDAYVRYGETPQRTQFLADVANAVFSRLTNGTTPINPRLLTLLGGAAAGGHIQIYATREDEQQQLDELGLTHGVDRARRANDVLGFITENWSPSKVDWFLRRNVSYDIRLDPWSRRATTRLRADLDNNAPPSGLPPLVIGPIPPGQVPAGYNRQLMLLLRPGNDELADTRLDGKPLPVTNDYESTLRAHLAYVTIPPGGRSVVDAGFVVPGAVRGTGRHRTYTLHVLRQPVAHPDAYDVRVRAPRGWKLSGRTAFHGPLTQDLVLRVHLTQTVRAWLVQSAVLNPFRHLRHLIFGS
jgi:hypothetical protein